MLHSLADNGIMHYYSVQSSLMDRQSAPTGSPPNAFLSARNETYAREDPRSDYRRSSGSSLYSDLVVYLSTHIQDPHRASSAWHSILCIQGIHAL